MTGEHAGSMPFERYLATLDEIPMLRAILGMGTLSEENDEFYKDRDGVPEVKRDVL